MGEESPGWVTQLVRVVHQGCGIDSPSGHIQECTNECINQWNNNSVFLSLSLSNQYTK